MISPEIQYLLNLADEQAQASFQWAEEFMQAVKEYLGT